MTPAPHDLEYDQGTGLPARCTRCGNVWQYPPPVEEPCPVQPAASLLERAIRGRGDAWDAIGRRHGG